MMDVLSALSIPVIVFLAIIAPLWITLHYITVWRRMRAESEARLNRDEDLEALQALAERLDKRLETLEAVLDSESPNWRHK